MDDDPCIAGVPVTKLGFFVPVSQEALDDAAGLRAVWNRTPEEWQRAAELRKERHAAELAAAVARHEAVLARLDGRLAEVADLHGPCRGVVHGVVCRGCEFEGMEGEPPEWPCSTWVITAG